MIRAFTPAAGTLSIWKTAPVPCFVMTVTIAEVLDPLAVTAPRIRKVTAAPTLLLATSAPSTTTSVTSSLFRTGRSAPLSPPMPMASASSHRVPSLS